MSEPELAFESGLEGWIRFKHSEMRGKVILGRRKKEELLWAARFYGYLYTRTIQNIFGTFEAKPDMDLWFKKLTVTLVIHSLN